MRLEQWCDRYNVDRSRITEVCRWIDDSTLGRCTYHSDGSVEIAITDLFRDHWLAYDVVLWHEFCHAEPWIKEHRSDGHNSLWSGRLWRKPLYALLDYTYTKLLFLELKIKGGRLQ